jgi:hypothetical protein
VPRPRLGRRFVAEDQVIVGKSFGCDMSLDLGGDLLSMYKTGYTITNFATLFAGDAGEAADAVGTLDRLTLETTDAAGQTLKAARNEAGTAQLLTPRPGTDFHLPVTCGGASFTAGTKVLLASGRAVPIADLRPGEKVLATNTRTGTTSAETVTAVMVRFDTNRYDLTAAPRAPRPAQDFGVSSPGDTVGPYSPSSPTDVAHGASTFTDPKLAGLTGQYHVLPVGTQLPDGLGAFADGADVGGPMPAGHWTIFPTAPMTVSEFGDLFLSLPWQWAGKI